LRCKSLECLSICLCAVSASKAHVVVDVMRLIDVINVHDVTNENDVKCVTGVTHNGDVIRVHDVTSNEDVECVTDDSSNSDVMHVHDVTSCDDVKCVIGVTRVADVAFIARLEIWKKEKEISHYFFDSVCTSLILTQDGLDRHPEVSLHIAPLVDDGNPVDQGDWVHQVGKVDVRATNKPEPETS